MSMAACKTMVFGKALTMQKKIAVGKQAVNILGRKSWVETECRWRLMIEILISFIPVISLGIISDWIWLRILMKPYNPNTSWGKLHCVSTGKPLLVCPRTIKTFSIWEVINSIVPLTKETTGRPFLQIWPKEERKAMWLLELWPPLANLLFNLGCFTREVMMVKFREPKTAVPVGSCFQISYLKTFGWVELWLLRIRKTEFMQRSTGIEMMISRLMCTWAKMLEKVGKP